jgi:hypothetical protein
MNNLLHKLLSTWFDETKPDVRTLNQGAMASTAIGLFGGLTIAAFLVFAENLAEPRDFCAPKTLFSLAVAGLFATCAFGRAKTHFARGTYYDFWQILLDAFIVIAGAALVGLLSRSTFAYDGWTWWWLGVFLLFQDVRNAYLSYYYGVQGLRIGILFIGSAFTTDLVIGLFFPDSGTAARAFAASGLVLVVIQFSVEQLWFYWKHRPPRQLAQSAAA